MHEQSQLEGDRRFSNIQEKFAERREKWRQFRQDYYVGGGLWTGAKNAVSWGFWAGLGGGACGGIILGGIVDIGGYSIDTIGPASVGRPLFDTTQAGDDLLKNPYVTVPLVLAGISAIIAGGFGFYRGMVSPAQTGRRIREAVDFPWDTYFH